MRSCTERGEAGQSTVEAALLLPTVMFALAFLLQPMCLLYTRSVMHAAATEAARAAATAPEGADGERYEELALRRLAAVPDVSVFHEGGRDGWEVDVTGAGGDVVGVEVVGRVRPIPLLGVMARAFGPVEGGLVVVEASVSERVRPSWLEGGYRDWIGVWDG